MQELLTPYLLVNINFFLCIRNVDFWEHLTFFPWLSLFSFLLLEFKERQLLRLVLSPTAHHPPPQHPPLYRPPAPLDCVHSPQFCFIIFLNYGYKNFTLEFSDYKLPRDKGNFCYGLHTCKQQSNEIHAFVTIFAVGNNMSILSKRSFVFVMTIP